MLLATLVLASTCVWQGPYLGTIQEFIPSGKRECADDWKGVCPDMTYIRLEQDSDKFPKGFIGRIKSYIAPTGDTVKFSYCEVRGAHLVKIHIEES